MRRLASLLLALAFLAPLSAQAQVLAYPSGVAGLSVNNCATAQRLLYLSSTNVTGCSTLSYDGTDTTLASGQLIVPAGTAALPSLKLGPDDQSGLHGVAAGGAVYVTIAGSNALATNATQFLLASGYSLNFVPGDPATTSPDLILARLAAANLRHGAAAADPPVAQTLSVQNAAGTDIAGANFTIDASQGTGTGAGGSVIVRTAAAGGTGSSLNALAAALTINSAKLATFAGQAQVTPPATQTVAATETVTADACGSIKRVTAASAVTTSTTNTFTAPAAGNAGCVMYVVNVGANNITLDTNANFVSPGAADVVLGPNDAIIVGSTGASGAWYALSALVAN